MKKKASVHFNIKFTDEIFNVESAKYFIECETRSGFLWPCSSTPFICIQKLLLLLVDKKKYFMTAVV